jgi:hypothetical protein
MCHVQLEGARIIAPVIPRHETITSEYADLFAPSMDSRKWFQFHDHYPWIENMRQFISEGGDKSFQSTQSVLFAGADQVDMFT